MSSLVSFFAALPLLGALGAAGSLRLSDSTTAYLRSRLVGPGTALDLATTPEADASLMWRRARINLRYAPQLTLRDTAGPDSPTLLVMHDASAVATYATRRLELQLGQSLSMGRWNPGTLTQLSDRDPTEPESATTARTALLPNAASIELRSEQTSFSGSYRLTRRTGSTVRGSYGIFGGASGESRLVQPLQRTATVALSVAHALTRRQQLETTLGGVQTSTSNGYEHWVATAAEAWSLSVSRSTSTSLALGAFFYDSRGPDDLQSSGLVPSGALSVRQAGVLGRVHTRLLAGSSVLPFLNTLTGELQTSLQATTSLSAQYLDTTVSIYGDALQTLPLGGTRSARVLGAGLRLEQELSDTFALMAGARVQHQELASAELLVPYQWVVYAGAVVRAPVLSF